MIRRSGAVLLFTFSLAAICFALHPAIVARFGPKGAAAASYTAAATLVGTNAWMERDANWTGCVNSKQGLLSIRYKFDATNGTTVLYDAASDMVEVTKQPDGTMRVRCRNTANATVVQMDQDTAKVARATIGTWNHILASWDTTAGVVTGHLYINNIEAMLTSSRVITADGIVACGTNDHSIGQAVGGGFVHPGCISEPWVTFGQFQDISQSANRLKWGDGSDAPISLGSDGSTPTGTQPFAYFKDSGVPFTNNYGSGGFTFKKGATAFTACSDHP